MVDGAGASVPGGAARGALSADGPTGAAEGGRPLTAGAARWNCAAAGPNVPGTAKQKTSKANATPSRRNHVLDNVLDNLLTRQNPTRTGSTARGLVNSSKR